MRILYPLGYRFYKTPTSGLELVKTIYSYDIIIAEHLKGFGDEPDPIVNEIIPTWFMNILHSKDE